MVIASIDFDNPGFWTTVVAALFPILLGATATYFKMFVDPPKEFRDRVRLKRKEMLEQAAMLHTTLLNHSRRIDSDEALRGDGREQPDLIGNYSRELFRTILVFERVEFIRLIVRLSYYVIFAAIVLGVFCGLVGAVFDGSRKFVLWIAVTLFAIEVFVILVVYLSAERLESYEETT